jgi:hypothetical protein
MSHKMFARYSGLMSSELSPTVVSLFEGMHSLSTVSPREVGAVDLFLHGCNHPVGWYLVLRLFNHKRGGTDAPASVSPA